MGNSQQKLNHANIDQWLFKACMLKETYVVKSLIESKANVNKYSCLMEASQNGYLDIVNLLLHANADTHTSDDYSLKYATMFGHKEVVETLLKAHANVNAGDDYSLITACKCKHNDIVKILLQYRADINKLSSDFIASQSTNLPYLLELENMGCDVIFVDKFNSFKLQVILLLEQYIVRQLVNVVISYI